MAKGIRVFEVLADIDGDGPACDGTKVFRFWHEREANSFAARSTCYGRPATVTSDVVSPQLARRWGRA